MYTKALCSLAILAGSAFAAPAKSVATYTRYSTSYSASTYTSAISDGAETTLSINPDYVTLADNIAREIQEDQECYFTNKELFEHAVSFANDYLYPANTKQAEMINSTYFAEDVVGRIDVTRNFEGRELNTEYLFGLFTQLNNSDISSLLGYSVAYDMYEFVGSCNQYSMSVVNNATFPTNGNAVIPFSVNIWIKLDRYKKIVQYDLSFLKFDRFFGLVELGAYQLLSNNKTATSIPDEGYDLIKSALVESICEVHEKYCQEDYPQYDSQEDCIEYLTNTRLGESWEGGDDSVWCRSIHQNMIEYRPSVHCPHLGPSGGDMCVSEGTGYEEVVFNYNSTFSKPWIVV